MVRGPDREKVVHQTKPSQLGFGRFRLIPEQRLLLRDGVPVNIGSRAMSILIALVSNPGSVISSAALMKAVWPDTVVEENNLRVQMTALRRALEEDATHRYIQTIPLQGYVFVAPIGSHVDAGVETSPSSGEVLGMVGLASLRQGGAPLPNRITQLVGRSSNVAMLQEALPERRLVTLVGPAGIGKTSIAVVAAAQLALGFHDGVRFADLAPLSDPCHLHSAVAAALGIRVLSDNPREAIMAGLQDRNLLLVLDNCEHVIEAVSTLAEEVLTHAPGVQIIATSREALRASGEWVHRVSPLPAPEPGEKLTLEEARLYPAVQLFLERVRQSADDASFSDADVETLAWICRELDGVPLAIELIAARFSMLGLPGLVARMSDRLESLGQGRRSAHPRHRTLRAALDWSYDLLTLEEQRLLRALSIFRGNFSLEAVCAVGVACGEHRVPELLSELLAKSLVSVDHRNEAAPYRLLATTRAYGQERLIGEGEQEAISELHLKWLRDTLCAAEKTLPRVHPTIWRQRNGGRIDDVRAAIKWARDRESLRLHLVELVAYSAPLWFHLGLLSEALGALRWAARHQTAASVAVDVELRTALAYSHVATILEGPSLEFDECLQRAHLLAEQPGSPILRMQSSWMHFIRDIIIGDYASSLRFCEEFRARAERASDREAVFVYHRMRSLSCHLLGRQPEALGEARKALAPMAGVEMRLLHGDPQQSDHRSASLTHMSRILFLSGKTRMALEAAAEAYQESMEADRKQSPVYALSYGVCAVMLWAGKLEMAEHYTSLLRDATTRNAMPFWSLWPTLYEFALRKLRLKEAVTDAEVAEFGFNASHKDMLATLGVGYCSPEVVARTEGGKCEWARPEVLRVAALRNAASGSSKATVSEQLHQAIDLARIQGAHGWQLRAALSLAALEECASPQNSALGQVVEAFNLTESDALSSEEQRASRFLAGDPLWKEYPVGPAPLVG